MSNKPFDEKKVFYGQSNFYYTRLLAGHPSWQVSDIEARSRELVRAALKVWTLPPEYQSSIPTEASILGMIEKALPGKVTNCYAHRSGGGKYMAVLQCRKTVHTDEGKQRQAALLAFSAFPELKHVILVDEDVDIFDTNDVLWAMNTRFQGDRDIITIPGVRCHPLDPSSDPAYTGSIRDVGISTKTIFDCTVPFALKERFQRASFLELDPKKWVNSYDG